MNAYVLGKLNYLLPIYLNAPKYLTNTLHKVIMSAARSAIGSYCFKKSMIYILDKLNWLSIDKLITYSSICYIHKIIKLNQPESMMDLFRTKVSNRAISKWYTKYQPKTIQMKNFYIYKALEYFLQFT